MSPHHVKRSRRVVISSRAWSSPQTVGHLPLSVFKRTGRSRRKRGTRRRSRSSSTTDSSLGAMTPIAPPTLKSTPSSSG